MLGSAELVLWCRVVEMVLTFTQGRAVRFICRFLHPHKMSSPILRKDFSMNIRLGRLDGTLQIVYIWLSLWKLVDTNEDLSQIDCSSRNSLLTPTPFLWSLRYSWPGAYSVSQLSVGMWQGTVSSGNQQQTVNYDVHPFSAEQQEKERKEAAFCTGGFLRTESACQSPGES